MARIWAPILIIIGATALFVGGFLPYAHVGSFDIKFLNFDHQPRSVWFVQLGFVLPTLATVGAGIMAFYRRSSWLYAAVAGFMVSQLLYNVGLFLAESVNSAFWGHLSYGLIFLFLGPTCALAGALVGFLDELDMLKSLQPTLVAPAHQPTTAAAMAPNPASKQVAAPAGWYSDPSGHAAQRYWDGQAWTDRVA
jgi:Protein of unknown function (DUF2510)